MLKYTSEKFNVFYIEMILYVLNGYVLPPEVTIVWSVVSGFLQVDVKVLVNAPDIVDAHWLLFSPMDPSPVVSLLMPFMFWWLDCLGLDCDENRPRTVSSVAEYTTINC